MVGLAVSCASILMAQQAAAPRTDALPFAHLAAGDDVVVTVFREKDLSARVFVDEANDLALPKLGVISVGTLTSDMLRDSLRARYATFLREPAVDVRAMRRVTVNGAVLKPDVYFVDPSMALRDVVARAGGVTSEGNMKDVSIVRGGIRTPFPNWSTGPQGQEALRSGDEVLVGRRSWVSLNIGAVIGVAGLLTSLLIAFKH
ncbi:MAG TPA: polysaccharide biosynthesis/export family protein [Gemmatimonadaceae bacterium]|jgi:polysaccharide export outer membrane protein